MNTLRVRLAILLVVAIVLVVALASLVAISVLGLPSSERVFEASGRQIIAFAEQARRQPDLPAQVGDSGGWFSLQPDPAPGSDPELTEALRAAFRRLGSSLEPTATRNSAETGLLISVPIADRGWIVIPTVFPERPREGWLALVSWLLVIVGGTITVALRLAYKMTQPLHLLQQAVASVGTDGVLPPVPEAGSAEVRETAKALNLLSAQLKSAMESRIRLVAAAGHDLRTPMTRMRLRAEFIADEEERDNWLKDLDELDHIADSAIGLVREEVDTTATRPRRLDSLVAEIVEELAALQLPIKAGVLEPTIVNAAPWSLKRALRNLLSNAATHGGGGTVMVRRADGKAVVTILDDGPGIPPDLLGRVFEPFFQVDPARRRTFGGAGLGLAIAREIVVRSGGTITLENRPEGGLRQTITFSEAEFPSEFGGQAFDPLPLPWPGSRR